MSRYSKRQIALIAELLADKLISLYIDEQIPAMVEGFAAAGFTKIGLVSDPIKLFQMLVIAAYDRRPFTPAAGGSEEIWGMKRGAQSIPQVLASLGLFTPDQLRRLSQDAIQRRLGSRPYFGRSLATDDERVDFARTLIDSTRIIEEGLHGQVLQASTADDVQVIYKTLTDVHGIGDTIGSKLVKYLLREINIGKVPPEAFPLTVVWPITSEYHVNEAMERLTAGLERTLGLLTMGVLLGRGEPFAIDALFYLNRHYAWKIDEFIEDVRAWLASPPSKPKIRSEKPPQTTSPNLAQKLFQVIEEIYAASQNVSREEIRRVDLQGLVSPKRIKSSGRYLYFEMSQLASEGNAAEMMAFYENCLHSERGKDIGWALDRLGRTSMESEADRFRGIFEGRTG